MRLRACRDVRADLSAYLDGDLDAGLTGETRTHLENCASCQAELELLRLTTGALRRLPDLPPPAAVLAGVRARLRPEPWYRRLPAGRRWPLGVPIGAFATLLVIVGISLFQARYPGIERMAEKAPVVPVEPLTSGPRQAAGSRPQERKLATVPAPPKAKEKSEATEPATKPSVADLKDSGSLQDRGLGTPSRDVANVGALEERSRTVSGADAELRSARPSAASRAASPESISPRHLRIVCLLPPDGGSVADLEQLLRREGAGEISISELEPRAVREAIAPHRARLGSLPNPVRGWTVTAGIPLSGFTRLIDELASRPNLRILEQPAASTAPEDPTAPRDLHITVLR